MVLVPIYADDGVTQLTDDAGNILLVDDGTAGLLTFVSQQDFFAIARTEQSPLFRMPRFADSLPPPFSRLLPFISQQDFFQIARVEQTPFFRMAQSVSGLMPPFTGGGGGGTFFLNVGVIFQLPPPKGQVV